LEKEGKLPDAIFACVVVAVTRLEDEQVQPIGVKPTGKSLDTSDHAATLSLGTKGVLNGMCCYILKVNRSQFIVLHQDWDFPGVGECR
jgi:tryptophan synthase beta subunit